MARLYQRDWRIVVGGIQVRPPLDVRFEVEKSTKPEPNSVTLDLYNLAPSNRSTLTEREDLTCIVEAGYREPDGTRTVIYSGDVRKGRTHRDGPNLVTTLEGEEGGRAYASKRINRSFPPGTSIETVVRACADALQIGAGNVAEVVRGRRLEGAGTVFPGGVTLSGLASRELTGLLRSLGLRWSVQAGTLQVLERGRPLQGTAVLLRPSTGLLGRPSVDKDGLVEFRCLMIPDVWPGRRIKIESPELTGVYTVERATYIGDTAGNDWYIECEAKE